MSSKQILLVDDDAAFCETFADHIDGSDDFTLDAAGSTEEARFRMKEVVGSYDIILLDVGLPDGDGRDFCASLRQQGFNLPVIMLSGHIRESDIVRGLEAGANDYVTKPCRIAEVLARIRAQLRATATSFQSKVSIGPWIFQHASRVIQKEGSKNRVHLTKKEADFLRFMYQCVGKPVSSRTLLSEVWGYNEKTDSHTIRTHVYRLRRKLETMHDSTVSIATCGDGYNLTISA